MPVKKEKTGSSLSIEQTRTIEAIIAHLGKADLLIELFSKIIETHPAPINSEKLKHLLTWEVETSAKQHKAVPKKNLRNKTDPALLKHRREVAFRQRLGDLRDHLEDICKRFPLDWEVTIATTNAGYLCKFTPNQDFYLRRFWHSYLKYHGKAPRTTHISFTALRFFRNVAGRYFFRHLDINPQTPDRTINEMARAFPALSAALENLSIEEAKEKVVVRDSTFFTTTGEMACVLKMTRLLERHQVVTEYKENDRVEDLQPLDYNLFIIGNTRTHPAIQKLQKDPHYTDNWRWKIGDRGIEALSKKDRSFVDFEPANTVHCLLSRMPRKRNDGSVVTIIAGNHGEVFRAVADWLDRDEHLKPLFTTHLKWSDTEPVPERFQIVFSVDIDSSDTLEAPARVIDAHWI